MYGMSETALLTDAANHILLLTKTASRQIGNSDLKVDFTQALLVHLALKTAAATPSLIKEMEAKKDQTPLIAETLVALKDAYTDFCDFIVVFANQSGLDTPEQIAGNIKRLIEADVTDLVIGNEWV